MKDSIKIAIIGNPNVGKSTIFNNLTRSNQQVGNYSGVTVDKKEIEIIYKNYKIILVDLPGIYSLSTYSNDEIVTKDFLLRNKIDIIINVLNANSLNRNLYLFTQIIELKIYTIVVLNMIDILESHDKKIDITKMANIIGYPIFTTIANKGIGIKNLLNYIIKICKKNEIEKQLKTKAKINYGTEISNEMNKLNNLVSINIKLSQFPKTWFLMKLLECDFSILKFLQNKNHEIIKQIYASNKYIKKKFKKDIKTIIASKRYCFVESIISEIIAKKNNNKRFIDITEIIDRFVLNKYLELPIFFFVTYFIFKFTFSFSKPIVFLLNSCFKIIGNRIPVIISNNYLQSLLVNGIIGGVGSVLGFFPIIIFMFLAISFLEDFGYMSRSAFIMDKITSKFGIGGKSFLPLMLSTNGCAVPGIIATRMLDSKHDRFITMFIVPYMICGAKIPVFALIIGAIFDIKYQSIIMFLMYIISFIIALSVAKLLSILTKKNETIDSYNFIIELPPYNFPPIFKTLLSKTWQRSWLYLRKASILVITTSILTWVIFSAPWPINSKNNIQQNNIANNISKIIEPVFKPIGMDGKKAISLFSGFIAKEMIVSTLSTVYSVEYKNKFITLKERIRENRDWKPLKAITFLLFCLIYMPCMSTVAIFFKEVGAKYKWLMLMTLGNTVLAWIISFIVYQIGKFLKLGI